LSLTAQTLHWLYITSANKTERQNLTTESLIVELDARTAKLDAKLNSTNDKLDKLTEKSNKSDEGLKKLGSGAKMAGTAILQTAAAAVALSGAVTAIVLSSAKGRRELELLAKQAKTTTSDFQALAFAASRYGINAEQIGDISKEISLKVAEFSTAGTGAFQDYADVLQLTKTQAREAANEFENMSSQEILGLMVSRMEEAGASAGDMAFAIDSLASDSERLIPLFIGNSKELQELKKRFDDVNKSLQITGTQAEALRDVSNTFTLLSSSAGNATTAISATLAPVLDDFFNDIIDIVPEATQTIINFINSFLDAENISSIAGVNKQIKDVNESITETTEIMIGQIPRMKVGSEAQLRRDNQRLKELEAQLVVLTDQEKKLADVNRLSGGQIGGESGDSLTPLVMADEEEKRLETLRQFTMTRAELLDAELVADIQRLELAAETFGLKDQELYERRLEIIRDFAGRKESLENDGVDEFKDGTEEETEAGEKAAAKKLNQQQTGIRAGMALNTLLFEDNKAIAAGLIVADTAAAIMASLKIQPFNYVNVGLLAATGAVQVANALSSSKGGGGSLSAPTAAPQQSLQQSFNDQGTTITDISDGEVTSQRLVIEFNDEVVDAISRQIQKSQSDGRT
jgi:tetrahydromethanopterin S-methyltransferase subunit G